MFELKKSKEELYFMTLECDANFEEKLTCGLQNDTRNLTKFYQSTWKSPNWNLGGILLSEVEKVWAYILQGNYVSWQWKMMRTLKRNWLVSSKWTWGIWGISTRALKNFKNLHFNGLLLTKVSLREKCPNTE